MDQQASQPNFRISEVQSSPNESALNSSQRIALLIRSGAIFFVVLVICSYLFHWHWTGFDNNTLWQWMKLLLVPLAAALVPFWLSTHGRWQSRWNILFMGTLALLVFLLVTTYIFDWKWTGLHGTTLWDWLNMLLLPLALTALMVWVSVKPRWQPQWTLLTALLCGILLLIVIAGYAFRWRWAGFYGNTVWDWLNLLVLPFVLPAVVIWLSAQQDSRKGDEAKEQHPAPASASFQDSRIENIAAPQKYPEPYIHDGQTVHVPGISVRSAERERTDDAEETVFLHPDVPLAEQGEQGIEGL